MIKLESERLLLKPIAKEFCSEKYLSWLNDPEIYKYMETRGDQKLEDLEEFIRRQVTNHVYMWAITIKTNGNHIGNIKIDPINERHSLGEYGILIGDKQEWRKGYAREASELVIDYFFYKKNPLRKITLGVVKENTSAVDLYLKMGFLIEGNYRKHVCYDGNYYDILRMALFNSIDDK
jgi:ribosomal-protein-alanine N-acetyltransferase